MPSGEVKVWFEVKGHPGQQAKEEKTYNVKQARQNGDDQARPANHVDMRAEAARGILPELAASASSSRWTKISSRPRRTMPQCGGAKTLNGKLRVGILS
jgi:hypothetical protein